jgi:hypothetical protein
VDEVVGGQGVGDAEGEGFEEVGEGGVVQGWRVFGGQR